MSWILHTKPNLNKSGWEKKKITATFVRNRAIVILIVKYKHDEGQSYDWNENKTVARSTVRCRTNLAHRYPTYIYSMCVMCTAWMNEWRVSVCAVHFDLKWFNTSHSAVLYTNVHTHTQCTKASNMAHSHCKAFIALAFPLPLELCFANQMNIL